MLGWQTALLALSLMVLLIVLAFGLREPGFSGSAPLQRSQSVGEAMTEAFRTPSFLLLTAGYWCAAFRWCLSAYTRPVT